MEWYAGLLVGSCRSVIVECREHVEDTLSGTEADLLQDVLTWGSIDLMQGGGFEMITDVGGAMSPSFYLACSWDPPVIRGCRIRWKGRNDHSARHPSLPSTLL